jgi:hypothetical protein
MCTDNCKYYINLGTYMQALRDQLTKSLGGGQAFLPYRKALEDIKPEHRNFKTNENLHSIYEELEHMRIAQQDLLYYAIEAKWDSPEWPDGFWPKPRTKITDDEWNASVEGFFSDLEKAIQLVNNPDIDLLSIIPGSIEYTYLREIVIIIEHNAYHLGKIMDIRKALGSWKR